MTQADDEIKLILRMQAGDEQALAQLYERLHRHVYALALEMLKNSEDAEEVLQDTFVNVFKSAHRFDAKRGSARSYLYTIARNQARMRLRARASRPRQAELTPDEAQGSNANSPDYTTPMSINAALDALEQQDRQLLEASFYQGYSHRELAETTGLALGTIKSRIRRALLRLRELLETP
jgi:RNA polymerase sigma-70 factor (ECF subfamily)